MNAERVDLLIQYTLAVAAEEDHPYDRELRPIHLIKYCYLADLAYARDHGGASYTGAPWQFYNFGPWSLDLYKRVEPAARKIEAQERRFSTAHQEDAVSWSVANRGIRPEQLESGIPGEVASAVKTAVHQFGSDTVSLLHHVYTTEPMLRAAPGEPLDLAVKAGEPRPAPEPEVAPVPLPQLSKTAVKRLRSSVKDRFQALKEKQATALPQGPPPPYDEIFFQGQEWLDSLAGEEIVNDAGRVTFSPTIWKSGGRREPKLP